jgi:hypothetical protein
MRFKADYICNDSLSALWGTKGKAYTRKPMHLLHGIRMSTGGRSTSCRLTQLGHNLIHTSAPLSLAHLMSLSPCPASLAVAPTFVSSDRPGKQETTQTLGHKRSKVTTDVIIVQKDHLDNHYDAMSFRGVAPRTPIRFELAP